MFQILEPDEVIKIRLAGQFLLVQTHYDLAMA